VARQDQRGAGADLDDGESLGVQGREGRGERDEERDPEEPPATQR